MRINVFLLVPVALFFLNSSAFAERIPITISDPVYRSAKLNAGIVLDFEFNELKLSPADAKKYPSIAKAVKDTNNEMQRLIEKNNQILIKEFPENFPIKKRRRSKHVNAVFNIMEIAIDRADECFLAVSAFCSARVGGMPDNELFIAIYDLSTGQRLGFTDIIADRMKFAKAVAEESASREDGAIREDFITDNPFIEKSGIEYLPISISEKEAIVYVPITRSHIEAVLVPFAKHPDVFTQRVQGRP